MYVIKTRRDKAREESNGVGWNSELEVGWGGVGEISFESRNGTKERKWANVCSDHWITAQRRNNINIA